MPKPAFYAVAKGKTPGVYATWAETQAQVNGFSGSNFKKFPSRKQAQDYVTSGGQVGQSAPAANSSTSTQGSPTKKRRIDPPATSSVKSTSSSRRQVFCDGACPGNGKASAVAGSGVFWNDKSRDLAERLPGKLQTNQRAELYAILRVLETDPTPSEILEILTDSAYSISCLSTWHKNWDKNGWKNASGQPVSNADLIKRILYLIRKRPFSGKLVFTHVRGHAGIEGNERADQLAVQGSYLPSKNERDYAAETDEDMLWDEVGDLPEDWADKLEFDIDTSTIPEAEMHS